MLLVIRRIFLVAGALALAVPSLSAALFSCPPPTAHREAAAPAAGRHEAGHAPVSGARPTDGADRVEGVREASRDAQASSCEHPCPDTVPCIAGASCAGAPTGAILQLATDAGNLPRQGIEPASMPWVRSRRAAPESPPPRL